MTGLKPAWHSLTPCIQQRLFVGLRGGFCYESLGAVATEQEGGKCAHTHLPIRPSARARENRNRNVFNVRKAGRTTDVAAFSSRTHW